MSLHFSVAHEEETDDDNDPVDVVRNDGSVRGRVLPAEDGVEDTPAAASVEFWVAVLVFISGWGWKLRDRCLR